MNAHTIALTDEEEKLLFDSFRDKKRSFSYDKELLFDKTDKLFQDILFRVAISILNPEVDPTIIDENDLRLLYLAIKTKSVKFMEEN